MGPPGTRGAPDGGRTVARLRERSVSAEGHLRLRRDRPTARVVSDAAGELGADLVVLAPRGSSSIEAAMRGSVTHELLNLLDTAVLLLRGAPRPALTRLLVATAGYRDVAAVTGLAAAMATRAEVDGWVVHVRSRSLASDASEFLESTEEATALALDAVCSLERVGMTAGYSVELGSTPYAIAMAARRTGADVIVLGRRRRLDWRDVLTAT